MTEAQINSVHAAFKSDPDAQRALMLAQPNGAGLKLVVEVLRASGLVSDEKIEQLAVFYSFDPARNPPSRSGVTMADQPVRGSLVADDGQNVSALNANPVIIGALCFAEVFPSRLEKVRQQWMASARRLTPQPTAVDIEAAALSIGLRISLDAFVGGPGDNDCPGSTCPTNVAHG